MSYNMILTWEPDCQFIFLSWKTQTWLGFTFGLILTYIFCILSTAYTPIFRKRIIEHSKSKPTLTAAYATEYILKLFVMFLMMTMNVYVLIAIALGTATGYTLIEKYKSLIHRKIRT